MTPHLLPITSPGAEFVGCYTIVGPQGWVEAATETDAEVLINKMLERYPNALHGKPRQNWHDKQWRITIWSRLELYDGH